MIDDILVYGTLGAMGIYLAYRVYSLRKQKHKQKPIIEMRPIDRELQDILNNPENKVRGRFE